MSKQNHQPFTMEITVISAQGLKNTSSTLFSHRLRPFISITTTPPTTWNSTSTTNGDEKCHVYTTRVDDQGGVNPAWGDKFHVPLDTTFFANRYSSIYIQLYTKRLIVGQSQLGWCQIPVTDIRRAPGSVQYLSYRVRDRDGTRGQGIVNLAIKLEGLAPVASHKVPQSTVVDTCQTVIGIPVTVLPRMSECLGVSCKETDRLTSGKKVGDDREKII